MQISRPLKIHAKFITGLVLATIFLGSLFSAFSYVHTNRVLEDEVREKSELIFLHVDSIQHYVRDILRPSMYQRFPAAFVMEAMSSSFISRQIMSPVNSYKGGIIYRRVAIGARNPDYEANELERRLIDFFRNDENPDLWQGYETVNGERYYVMARPVRFESSCMYCHGKIEGAPAELLTLYGEKGFGKQPGSVAGVDFVGTSVESSVSRLKHTIFTYFFFFAVAILFFFFTTYLLFRVLVVNNLKRLHEVFRKNINDAEGQILLGDLQQGDEIEELVENLEIMGTHLFEARAELQNYSENLREMVKERTDALSCEIEARRADVHLFVSLLENMYTSHSREQLWKLTLPQICRRFRACRISYICTMASQGAYFWPESESSPDIPENFPALLTGGVSVLSGTNIYVPVESGSGSTEGLLCLCWPNEAGAAEQDLNVLQAMGRQLGTAAENLTAIDSLARQMNILETIFENISDPLMLIDSNCTVLTVNRAAKSLAGELTKGQRLDGNVLALFMDTSSDNCAMRETIMKGTADNREVSLPGGRTFSLSLYPVRSESGDTNQVIVYIRETTREKRITKQVWQAEKMASVGKLTAGLAHEINNPLGVILCYTGLLRQVLTNPGQTADLDIIERHTRQAQRVLQDLLNFARPKAAGSGSADVCAVAATVHEVFSVQIAKKNVHTALECSKQSLIVGMGEGELEQVISNLLINALDAVAEKQGKIRIRIGQTADHKVSIAIADNGPGIAGEDEPHIFDPFFTTKEVGVGTGLGLTVTYGIVTDAGGVIEVGHSAELGGAEFTVLLPAAAFLAEP